MVHSSVPHPYPGRHEKPEHLKALLVRVLPVGKRFAQTCAFLTQMHGIKTDRTYTNIRTAAMMLLQEGKPVIGGNRGYFIVKNKEELEEKVKSLKVQIQGLHRTIGMIEKAQEQWFGKTEQQALFGD